MKKLIVLILSVFLLSSCDNIEEINDVIEEQKDYVSVLSTDSQEPNSDNYGSTGALQQEVFTLEEMLHYALQDEYTARAEYEYIMSIYGVQNPYENIMKSEETHIEMLLPLYETYGITLLEDTSSDHLFAFSSIEETYEIGVIAEINNIAMYNLFLGQDDLPEDVEEVFIYLRDASENHLDAFQRKVDKVSGN